MIERANEPVLVIDAARPVILVTETQRLGFFDAFLRFLADRQAKSLRREQAGQERFDWRGLRAAAMNCLKDRVGPIPFAVPAITLL